MQGPWARCTHVNTRFCLGTSGGCGTSRDGNKSIPRANLVQDTGERRKVTYSLHQHLPPRRSRASPASLRKQEHCAPNPPAHAGPSSPRRQARPLPLRRAAGALPIAQAGGLAAPCLRGPHSTARREHVRGQCSFLREQTVPKHQGRRTQPPRVSRDPHAPLPPWVGGVLEHLSHPGSMGVPEHLSHPGSSLPGGVLARTQPESRGGLELKCQQCEGSVPPQGQPSCSGQETGARGPAAPTSRRRQGKWPRLNSGTVTGSQEKRKGYP